MKAHYPSAGIVSVWVGNFESEEAFDEAVEREVADSLELFCDLADICEVSFEQNAAPIHTLLRGFSGDDTFLAPASEKAFEMGMKSANSALVCYHLKITELASLADSKLVFLGSFEGSDT